MKQKALALAAVCLLLLTLACGDDDEAGSPGESFSPVSTDGWFGFDAPSGCLSIRFPADWSIKTMGDLDEGGQKDCPGGSGIRNEIADECTPEVTGTVLGIARAEILDESADTDLLGWVELHGAVRRCETLAEHFEMIVISSNGSVVESSDGAIAGRDAKCAVGKRRFPEQTFDVRVCVGEIDGKLYVLTTTWDESRADELESVAKTIAASLQINPID
jgi:hypothetical protein